MISVPSHLLLLNGNNKLLNMKGFFSSFILLCILTMSTVHAQDLPVAQRQTETVIEGNETFILHTIQKGETLYSIARAYEVKASDIIDLNPDASGILSPGQKLKIKIHTANKLVQVPEIKPQPIESYVYHIVKKGQALKEISSIYSVPENEIMRVNGLNSKNIIADQVLKVPLDYSNFLEQDKPVAKSDDGFITHIVNPQETLYGISRHYNVTIADIIEWNPFVSEGLKPGQILRIKPRPIKNTDANPAQHIVGKKETLYGISRKYRVSIDSLKIFNPGLTEQLTEGQLIRIPDSKAAQFITHTAEKGGKTSDLAHNYNVSEEALKEANPGLGNKVKKDDKIKIPLEKVPTAVPSQNKVDTSESKVLELNTDPICPAEFKQIHRIFNVALMIPFALDEVDTSALRTGKSAAIKDLPFFRFMKFYEGSLLALDTLRKHGLKVNFHIFDASRKPEKTRKMLNRPEMMKMDLFISIAYSRNFELISEFCKQHEIPLVNAVSKRSEIVKDNPDVFKILPDDESQSENVVNYIVSLQRKTNVLIIRSNKYQYGPLCEQLRENLSSQADREEIKVTYLNDSISLLRRKLVAGRHNIIVCFSDNQAWIMDLMRILSASPDTSNITIIGMPSWAEMTNLDTKSMMKLNVHFLSAEIPDPISPLGTWFTNKFHQSYFAEPDELAYRGFDVTFFFMNALMRFGNDFNNCIGNLQMNTIQTRYRFSKNSPHGYENRFWNIYKYNNFRLEILNRSN